MIVHFCLVACVGVIMRSVVARMVVRVGHRVSGMIVRMLVLVKMFVGMSVGVFVSVLRVAVSMLVGVGVRVIVSVQVGVLVVAVHGVPPFGVPSGQRPPFASFNYRMGVRRYVVNEMISLPIMWHQTRLIAPFVSLPCH